MRNTIVQVDAFTAQPYAGNPAAVCILKEPADEQWMRHVAREMNLSETAFLHPENDGFRLRWLTPAIEVDLCGHATLASAHVLWEESHLATGDTARFYTRSGQLTARRQGDWIEMDFPSTPARPMDTPAGLVEAIGAPLQYVGSSIFDYFVEVESQEVLRALKPDMTGLARFTTRGIIVTSRGDGQYDFYSRFFAPGAGVDEDPVTGSAHCCLAPYWAERLGKDQMVGFQASERGGVVKVKLNGDRVLLQGQAVTVLRGDLLF